MPRSTTRGVRDDAHCIELQRFEPGVLAGLSQIIPYFRASASSERATVSNPVVHSEVYTDADHDGVIADAAHLQASK